MRKAVRHLKAADPVLAAVIERAGPYKIQYREPIFQTLVRSIVYQAIKQDFGLILGDLDGATFPMLAQHPALICPLAASQ